MTESVIQVFESPLVAVMSHLLSFLEQYSHLQQLQQQAEQYRMQLRRHRVQHRRKMKALRSSYRQRLRDKSNVIHSLEEAIAQQQTPSPDNDSKDASASPGLHKLVQSLCGLQGERSLLRGELHLLHAQLEQREQDRHSKVQAFQQQIDELKSCIEEREEELSKLRIASGATDSEKRMLCLSAENESLKQSLSVTQGLLQQLSIIPSQSSSLLIKENENLRSRVLHLESTLQQRVEQLSRLERQSEQDQWRRGEELRRRDERVKELQLELDKERSKEPVVKYVTQTVEVESPSTLRQLTESRQKNDQLKQRLSSEKERCKQLEEKIRRSDEVSCNLQHKIAAYEREIGTLQAELMKEIEHLEEKKDEAVKAAANCSQEQFQSLQDQFMTLQRRLNALPPTLRSMKTDYASLRSQVRNFAEFYGSAIKEAKNQASRNYMLVSQYQGVVFLNKISAAINEMSEANKDLLEKYRKEVALRRKYHEQLVELKGNIRVLCRVKPVLKEDQHDECQAVAVTSDPHNESALTVLSKGKAKTFELDRVFHPQATQEEVFQEIEPLITSCIDGYHVCIFAYGQTGSGKTYTMEGPVDNPGINQRALKHLFHEIEERKDMWTYTITVSSVEIYNEVLRGVFNSHIRESFNQIPREVGDIESEWTMFSSSIVDAAIQSCGRKGLGGVRISRRSQGLEGVRFGDHRISSLIFADDVVLLAPSSLDLQHALGRFAAECEAAGMRASTSKSEAMVLDQKKVSCVKELTRKAKISIYQSIYIPTLTYGHELWVMTERIRSQIQAAEMSFLHRVAGCSLRIGDLLSKDGEKLDIKINPDGTGQLHVPGLRIKEVKNFQHIKKILATARRNRITFGTQMNQHSSRSHALLTITVQGTDLASGTKTTGKLNLVDLAGSERVSKSGAEGERLKEAQNINRSLLALGDVIQALRGRQTYIPFRNSRLTYLLQDSLGKGNKTAMVVQISSLERNVEETLCSLKFAQRVCKVELGPAARKIESGSHCENYS
ncbi:hypothetical protein QTP70_013947 [Hemibagrus guttatus]|uniref:Kinesin motor domain-containing protein n=1 Tax=Hemibagrus guttatus TaxID=175788 RepID=A0AAE0RE28_9TELE|nr:hypothetical protein QTP70_013947 [Hemibagrus guttatus]